MKIIFSLWLTIILLSFLFPEGSITLNFSALFIWMITVFWLLKKDSKFSMVFLFFVISFTVASLSGLVAETGSFFSEIKQSSYLTGAVTRNLSLCAVLVLISFQTHKILSNVSLIKVGMPSVLNELFQKIIILAVLISNMVLLSIYVKYGSPNDYNVDRFYYWSNIAPTWGGVL